MRGARTILRLLGMALLTSGCSVEVAVDEQQVGQTGQAITGGAPASAGQLYATVALVNPADERSFCTGTLVAPTVVVTAAHCIKHQDPGSGVFTTPVAPSEVSVVWGLLDADYAPASNVAQVAAVHAAGFDGSPNPDPDPNPEELGRAEDIGVLLLGRPITEQPYAAILPLAEVDSRLAAGSPLVIAGYGLNAAGSGGTSGVLYIAETPFVRHNGYELLAGGSGQPDACEGDSGGPAYQIAGGATYLVGATSRGSANAMIACGEGGIWTLVPAYESWIASQSGGAYPPASSPGEDGGDEDDDGGCSVARVSPAASLCWALVALLVGWRAARARRRRDGTSSTDG